MQRTGVFRAILVGVDASEGAAHVVEVACALAKCTAAALTLLGVSTPPSAELQAEGYGLEEQQRSELTIRDELKRLSHIAEQMGLTVEAKLVQGDAERVLAETARDGEFDLVVIGHRDVSRLRRWLEGSTSEGLLRDARASVLVVRQDADIRD